MIYDCFTFELLHQLEDSGLLHGRNPLDFIREGNIRLGGKLPVNTHGGLLSEAHMVGLNHIVEAARQIRGEADRRQVPDARIVAVSGWGNLGDCSFALLGGANV
jgi:acetyl-CoA acetyltransferase